MRRAWTDENYTKMSTFLEDGYSDSNVAAMSIRKLLRDWWVLTVRESKIWS